MKKSEGKAVPFWKETPLVDEREIFTELASKKGSSLFLGRYSLSEILAVLNKKGLLKKGLLKEARKRFPGRSPSRSTLPNTRSRGSRSICASPGPRPSSSTSRSGKPSSSPRRPPTASPSSRRKKRWPSSG